MKIFFSLLLTLSLLVPSLIFAQGTPSFPDLKSTAFITTPSGLKIHVIEPGTGAKAVNGQKAYTYYAGWLENGIIFDTNMDGGGAYKFEVGEKKVIPGWEEAITHLAPGGKAYIMVPSELGYGKNGVPDLIPGGATLIFYMELEKLK